jgi:hypothetical protein
MNYQLYIMDSPRRVKNAGAYLLVLLKGNDQRVGVADDFFALHTGRLDDQRDLASHHEALEPREELRVLLERFLVDGALDACEAAKAAQALDLLQDSLLGKAFGEIELVLSGRLFPDLAVAQVDRLGTLTGKLGKPRSDAVDELIKKIVLASLELINPRAVLILDLFDLRVELLLLLQALAPDLDKLPQKLVDPGNYFSDVTLFRQQAPP